LSTNRRRRIAWGTILSVTAALIAWLGFIGLPTVGSVISAVGGLLSTARHGPPTIQPTLQANRWVAAAAMPTARSELATVAGSDGRVFAMGGYGGPDGSKLNTVEIYTPATHRWTTGAPMPTARSGLAATVGKDGRIYALGGAVGAVTAGQSPVATAEVYDPGRNRWAVIAPMPTARWALTAATGADGRIYAMGGSNGGLLASVDVFNPSNNTWASAHPMPTARDFLAAVTSGDGRIYALGGYNGDPNTPGGRGRLTTVEAYTSGTDSWATLASLPGPRDNFAAVIAGNGRVFVVGGYDGLSSLDTVDVYDVGAGVWSAGPRIHTARRGAAAARGSDGRIYLMGGAFIGPYYLPVTNAVDALTP
jgi:N-acetylneuraminic acid mutarotase